MSASCQVQLRRVFNGLQYEAMRRCRWRHLVVRFGDEQIADGGCRSLSAGLLEHGADKESNHVMEKAICLDDERETTRAIDPPRVSDGALVRVGRRGGAADGKTDEPMFAEDEGSGAIERGSFKVVPVRPFGSPPKGRAGFLICTDLIGIAPGRRAETSMELGTHLMRRRDPHIVWEECVE